MNDTSPNAANPEDNAPDAATGGQGQPHNAASGGQGQPQNAASTEPSATPGEERTGEPDAAGQDAPPPVGEQPPLEPEDVVIHLDDRPHPLAGLGSQAIGPLVHFFQDLAKTDSDIIALCSDSARKTQTSIGILIFCTGILAFLSGGYAVFTSFRSLTFAGLAGFFYSVIIMIFNREIVSTSSKRMLFIRLLFALVLGYIIAVPLELRFFEDTIRAEIADSNRLRNEDIFAQRDNTEKAYDDRVQTAQSSIASLRAELDQLESSASNATQSMIRDYNERRKDLLERIDTFTQKEFEYGRAMEQETVGMVAEGRTGRKGQGAAYREAERQKAMAADIVRQAKSDLENLDAEYAKSKSAQDDSPERAAFLDRRKQLTDGIAKREAEMAQLKTELSGKRQELDTRYQRVNVAYDLLASYETLHVITGKSTGALLISLAIKLVIILLEMIPVIVKFCVANNEYFATVHNEREIFVAQIEAAAKRNREEIEANPYAMPVRTVRDVLAMLSTRLR